MQYQYAAFYKFILFTKVLCKIVIYYSISITKNSELRFSKIMHLKYSIFNCRIKKLWNQSKIISICRISQIYTLTNTHLFSCKVVISYSISI